MILWFTLLPVKVMLDPGTKKRNAKLSLCFKWVYGFVLRHICYIQPVGRRLSPSWIYYKNWQADHETYMEMKETEYPKGSGQDGLSWGLGSKLPNGLQFPGFNIIMM